MDRRDRYKQIGQRMREAREEKSLTQVQLCELLSSPLTPTAISLYESGDREVPVEVLSEVAKITGVSVDYLATGNLKDASTINVALRADKDLWKNEKARKQIEDFIEFMKQRGDKKK